MGKNDLKIISRSEWNAQPPKLGIQRQEYQAYNARLPDVLENIIIHHTQMPDSYSPAQIQQYAFDKGWDDFAYHYYITGDGKIYEGRELKYIGAHAGQSFETTKGKDHDLRKDPDYGSIGIALGGILYATEPQMDSLRKLISLLKNQFPKTTQEGHLLLHREVDDKITRRKGLTPYREGGASTDCPGEALAKQVNELRNEGVVIQKNPSGKSRFTNFIFFLKRIIKSHLGTTR